ncbi:basic leucine zipper transcriptional factor ATF-like 3 [Spea bombifrons]|uniref:basic leucine zipper transcriptional factor ATF-like 3 n=1 Tax=Spea bombifrons TaxID=233779 RepID=UPI002349EE55|nr:basic leucine zipper transcriptional factor ATF-like 3 [Spea bombifrons]
MSGRSPSTSSALHRSAHNTSGSEADALSQGSDISDRKVRRREKNRVAAQRSRRKQTQKADKLHEEYECLEQENVSLKKEIGKLTDELKHLSQILKDHEQICPFLHCPVNYVTVPRISEAVATCLPR